MINKTIKDMSSLHQGRMSIYRQVGFIFFIFLFLITPKTISAQTFTSDKLKIQFGNFNMGSGKQTGGGYSLTNTTGQNAPGQFSNQGFVLKSGFQYIYDNIYPFSFQIDNLNINFGDLTPDVGSTASNNITITTPSRRGYQIMAVANRPLSSTIGTIIPDATCDSGTPCTESVSAPWTTNTAFGFGFNATNTAGIGTSAYFTNSTYYRHFASLSNQETGQIIMSESKPVKDSSAKITYKVLVSKFQPAGSYENSISFIAVPKY
ncbi:MAG: hypothetical protein WCG91_03970 [Candidatus Shapirobacteria bacterium]